MALACLCSFATRSLQGSHGRRLLTSASGATGVQAFDIKLLDFLVCPLSKAPLRWDAAASELVCDELGVAYPVKAGMPNLRPSDGRLLEAGDKEVDPTGQPWGDDADSAQQGTPSK